MHHRVSGLFARWVLIGGLVFAMLAPSSAHSESLDESLDKQREVYRLAVLAIGKDDQAIYDSLRRELDDYPLAIYLDYFDLAHAPERVSSTEALAFLEASADTPLPNRFLSTYLRRAGKDRRWRDFLAVKPEEPNSIYLKCYYFRARLSQGDKEAAWEGARKLWVHGKSQPKECDPLFDAWLGAGQLTDDIVWTRLLNAFEARQRSLLNYVAKKGSDNLRPQADTLLAVYRDPSTLPRQSLPPEDPRSREIASYGLAYLARYNPARALSQWRDIQPRMPFTEEQVHRVEYAIAKQGLFAQTESNDDWLAQEALPRLQDDQLVGIRLRWALAEEDWSALGRFLPLLSEEAQEETGWRYWGAMLQEHLGDSAASQDALKELSLERDYYGFLAADRLDQPYRFNHQKIESGQDNSAPGESAIARIEELKFHDEPALAHSEWYKLLQDTTDTAEVQDLMLFASSRGWHRMAIDAATRAKSWDALDYRFPVTYKEVFERYGDKRSVPATELMAIARRESAFYPLAESPVGARGLMQIMPATGKAVASKLGVPHSSAMLFDLEHNVRLGSAYYRQLLDRYDDNRIFAYTAYNAGPHRVSRWRHPAGEGLDVTLWIETIPYQETRNYVKAVLAYNVVFQYSLGDTQRLLTPAEQEAEY